MLATTAKEQAMEASITGMRDVREHIQLQVNQGMFLVIFNRGLDADYDWQRIISILRIDGYNVTVEGNAVRVSWS